MKTNKHEQNKSSFLENYGCWIVIVVIIIICVILASYSYYNDKQKKEVAHATMIDGLKNNNIKGVDEIKFGENIDSLICHLKRFNRGKVITSYDDIIEIDRIKLLDILWDKAIFYFSDNGLYKIEMMPANILSDRDMISNLYTKGTDGTSPPLPALSSCWGVWQDITNRVIIYFGTPHITDDDGKKKYEDSLVFWKYWFDEY